MRKTRSDCRVGTFEKKHGLPPGTIRNKNGRDTRSDKKIGTIRKEAKQEEHNHGKENKKKISFRRSCKITELYLQQQKFHERVFKTIGGVVTLALGVTVTMLGLKAIGSDEDLPQLDDENQNVA